MQATKLIAELQVLVAEFGDLPVKVPGDFSYEAVKQIFYSTGVNEDQEPFIEVNH